MSVDTASLSPEEAFKVIGSVEYEQLRDFSQIERLVSQLEKR
jgi:hypothetical protein